MAAAMGSIREEIVKSYDKEFLEKFPDQITSIMAEITDALMQPDRNSRQKFIDAGAILEDYGFGKMAIQRVLRGWDLLTTDVKSSYVQDFHLALEELNGIEEVAERVFKTTTPSNEEIAKNKAYWTEQRDNAQAALDAMNETKKGRPNGTSNTKTRSCQPKTQIMGLRSRPVEITVQTQPDGITGTDRTRKRQTRSYEGWKGKATRAGRKRIPAASCCHRQRGNGS